MNAESLGVGAYLATPVAIVDSDASRIRVANSAFLEWTHSESQPERVEEVIPDFSERRARRAIDKRALATVDTKMRDSGGRERWVRYRLRPIELDGEQLWMLEGSDESQAQMKQALLEANAAIIEENNQRLQSQARALDAANGQMRVVLDSVQQGLFVVDSQGHVRGARSRVTDEWLGGATDVPVGRLLGALDAELSDWVDIGVEACFDGVLPLSLALEQLPRRIQSSDRHFELSAQPIGVDSEDPERPPSALLFVLTDVTERAMRAKKERQERELIELASALLRDKWATERAFLEMDCVIEALLANPASEEASRLLHTIKGNSAQLGLGELANYCHVLEDEIAAGGEAMSRCQAEAVAARWQDCIDRLRGLVGDTDTASSSIEVTHEELDSFSEAMPEQRRDVMSAVLESWRWPRARELFVQLGRRASALADRLGRAPLRIEIDDEGLRLPHQEWAQLWASLVHLVRNAVDHGIESAQVRSEGGKDPSGLLRFSVRAESEAIVIQIWDDGRGIDWELVRRRFGRDASRETLAEALFSDGFSTREEVSAISGRGVGMGAVRNACRALGGDIELAPSEIGTVFNLRIPDVNAVRAAQATYMLRSSLKKATAERATPTNGAPPSARFD